MLVVIEKLFDRVEAPSVAALVYQLPAVEIMPEPFGVILTVPTAAPSAPTVPSVILPFEPEAKVRLWPAPVIAAASMVEEDVIERFPPMVMLAKSTDPESMVRAPVEVRAALPVMLPRYQVPAALRATDVDNGSGPIFVPSAPMLESVIVPEPEVKVIADVPRRVPRVMLSLVVVMENAPVGVMAPRVIAFVYQAPAVDITPEPFGVILTVPTAAPSAPTVPSVILPFEPDARVML